MKQSQDEAEGEYQRLRTVSPEWAWKFRILEAEAALWRGLYEDVLKILESQPGPPNKPELAIPRLTLESIAHARLHNFSEAERRLQLAEGLCRTTSDASCGEPIQARGLIALEQGQFAEARRAFELSLAFSRAHDNRFLESTSLLNMGAVSLREERFDEAIDSADAAFKVASDLGAEDVALVAQGNVGWAYYKLGDLENALDVFKKAEAHAAQLGDIFDQENELTNLGYVYLDEGKLDGAAQSFRKALELAQGIKSKEDIHNALRVLSRLALQCGDIKAARQYAEQALKIAGESGNRTDELYPMLVLGQVAALEGAPSEAEVKLRSVEQDPDCPAFLKWDAEHALARLYEAQRNFKSAQQEYRSALATFEGAREAVRHEHYQLSFLTNGWRIYDDYVHFLISQGKTNEALRWADFSRARTLADGLGLLQKKVSSEPPPLNAPEIARQAKGVVMFYWLGEKQSYVWVVTGQKVTLFTLPPAAQVNAAVQRYVAALKNGPEDPLESANSDGQMLYQMLIAPAEALLRKAPRAFIVPDGSLNGLNFEALLVPRPKLHYWIEDATIASASSLRVLSASYEPARNNARRLLLIGDSVAPNNNYPELPKAAVQVEAVARHFSKSQRQTFQRAEATPAAYLDSNPERFSYVHFVAHGTASRLSPLDSAIVLSKAGVGIDSFKLYARDIIRHPIHADLVTISACYGAGERNYSGEGLVGLSWAFLRAGAHNVIAALWEVTDTPAEQIMDEFYDELGKGASPGDALRAAKLSLLHGSRFQNAFYWAPFQLYVGS